MFFTKLKMVSLVFFWHFVTTTHCNIKFWKIYPPYCICIRQEFICMEYADLRIQLHSTQTLYGSHQPVLVFIDPKWGVCEELKLCRTPPPPPAAQVPNKLSFTTTTTTAACCGQKIRLMLYEIYIKSFYYIIRGPKSSFERKKHLNPGGRECLHKAKLKLF